MSDQRESRDHDDESSGPLDGQDKEAATVAIRLPLVILVAVLLMLGVGIWATLR